MKVKITPRDNSFQVSFTAYNERHRRSFKDFTTAKQWALKCENAVLNSLPIPGTKKFSEALSSNMTVQGLLNKTYLRYWKESSSKATAKTAIALIEEGLGARRLLSELTQAHIEALIEHWKLPEKAGGKNLSDATVNRYASVLRRSLTLAYRLSLIHTSLDVPHQQVKKHDRTLYLTAAELDELSECFAYSVGSKTAVHWMNIAVETGLRPKELINLRWCDLREFKCLTPPVVKNAVNRTIPLTDRAVEHFKQIASSLPSDFSMKSYILKSEDGRRYTKDRLNDDWTKARRILQRQDDPDFVPYILRHTFICRLVMAGISLPEVQQLAGHSNIQTTMRYIHLEPVTPEQFKKALAKPF